MPSLLVRHKWLILLVSLGLILPSLAVIRLFDFQHWSTGANIVKYIFADGRQIDNISASGAPWKWCHPSIGLQNLRHNGSLWTICKMPQKSRNPKTIIQPKDFLYALVQINPKNKLATIIPFPKKLKHYVTVGVAKGPDNEIAMIYSDREYSLILGIFNQQGWQLIPRKLPNSKDAKMLGISWIKGYLEIVYLPKKPISTSTKKRVTDIRLTPIIARFKNGEVKIKNMPSPNNVCEQSINGKKHWLCANYCRLSYQQRSWRAWFNKIVGINKDKNQKKKTIWATYSIDESGKTTFLNSNKCSIDFFNPGLSVFGHVEPELRARLGSADAVSQKLDGTVISVERVGLKNWTQIGINRIEFDGFGLKYRWLWRLKRNGLNYYARKFGNGWLAMRTDNTFRLKALLLDKKGKVIKSNFIARTNLWCNSLVTGVPIIRKDGGFWLVSRHGCSINLSSNLKRLDQYPLISHLNSHGSHFNSKEYSHLIKLIWVLFGLPIILLLAYLYTRLVKKTIKEALEIGLIVYLISASISLSQLWGFIN